MTTERNPEIASAANAKAITVGGAPEGFDARLVLNEVAQHKGPVVHIARDDKRLAIMQASLQFFAPDMPLLTFPGWDCLPYDRVSPNADVAAARMATLAGVWHVVSAQIFRLSKLS
ncbi:MAG: hypothetical protein ACKVLN_09020, partial [Rhodobacterales bacterium]